MRFLPVEARIAGGGLFQFARRCAEHVDRAFAFARDLYVRPSGRVDQCVDVVPISVGLSPRGRGKHWNWQELIQRGERAARRGGLMLPTAYDSIHFGLLQAARRNPLRVPAGDVPNLVRRALFDTDPAEDEHDPEFLEIVAGRALEAIGKHLDPDENSKRFKAWLFGPGNSFISQIAKQRKAPGGTLDRERVRRALLQLGWNAYRKAADFIHAQMRDFENALPEPLSETERTLFEHAHLRQPYLGELPLVLISERMSFVRRAVLAIWENPEERRHQSVLHRLLEYYALMVRSRKEADRRFKPGLSRNPHTGQRTKSFVFDEARDRQIDSRRSVAADVAESLRELRRIKCKCRDPRWQFNVLDSNRKSIRVEYLCEGCGLRFETTASRNELLGLIDDA